LRRLKRAGYPIGKEAIDYNSWLLLGTLEEFAGASERKL
jgi:hypothetical protein